MTRRTERPADARLDRRQRAEEAGEVRGGVVVGLDVARGVGADLAASRSRTAGAGKKCSSAPMSKQTRSLLMHRILPRDAHTIVRVWRHLGTADDHHQQLVRADKRNRRPRAPTTLIAGAGVVVARRDPPGMAIVPARHAIAIPAGLRHRCGLGPGTGCCWRDGLSVTALAGSHKED